MQDYSDRCLPYLQADLLSTLEDEISASIITEAECHARAHPVG